MLRLFSVHRKTDIAEQHFPNPNYEYEQRIFPALFLKVLFADCRLRSSKQEKQDLYYNFQDKNSCIVGSFGKLDKKIDAIGFLYFEKRIIQRYDLFRLIIILKYLIKNDKEFVKRIEKELDTLDIEYKYIWRVINLPDTSFACIIKFCEL